MTKKQKACKHKWIEESVGMVLVAGNVWENSVIRCAKCGVIINYKGKKHERKKDGNVK